MMKDGCLHGLTTCPWKWLVGVALLAALIVVVGDVVGWRETLLVWQSVDPLSLLFAFLLYFISHVFRAIRIHLLLFNENIFSQRFLAVGKLSAWHQFANNILPMRLGEIVFPILMKRYFHAQWRQGFGSLVWLRIFDLIVVGIGIASLFLIAQGMSLLIILGIVFIFILIRLASTTNIKKIDFRWQFLNKTVDTLYETSPKSNRDVYKLALLTILAWTSKLVALSVVIQAFFPISLLVALSGVFGGEVTSILPIHGIAGAGSYEFGFSVGMLSQSLTIDQTLKAAINTHIFLLVSTTLVAVIFAPISLKTRVRSQKLVSTNDSNSLFRNY